MSVAGGSKDPPCSGEVTVEPGNDVVEDAAPLRLVVDLVEEAFVDGEGAVPGVERAGEGLGTARVGEAVGAAVEQEQRHREPGGTGEGGVGEPRGDGPVPAAVLAEAVDQRDHRLGVTVRFPLPGVERRSARVDVLFTLPHRRPPHPGHEPAGTSGPVWWSVTAVENRSPSTTRPSSSRRRSRRARSTTTAVGRWSDRRAASPRATAVLATPS